MIQSRNEIPLSYSSATSLEADVAPFSVHKICLAHCTYEPGIDESYSPFKGQCWQQWSGRRPLDTEQS